MNIKILDCTLRDGSHVNSGDFGANTIKNIITSLNDSKVDIIEAGFLRDVTYKDGSSIFNKLEEFETLVENKYSSEISLMIRPDQYDINKLNKKSKYVDILRFAFHKEDIELTKRYITKALNLGYKVGVNPVNIGAYSTNEIENILLDINHLPIESISVVDTFGVLKKDSFFDICKIFEQNLPKSIDLGIHLHENLSLSFGLVCDYLKFGNKERNIIIDGSLFGMGRIPGNLCTEIIMSHLIKEYKKDYDLGPSLNIISKAIEPIKSRINWGYSPIYLLTAEKNIHRSYGEFLSIRSINYRTSNAILDEVKVFNKGEKFDEDFIKELLKKYQ
ncbi:MAG: 4-hydroxy-2-ketovalerate aldolase [Arcobacter sp.]|nr:4-hydroxy-2-ketovalerate aldolase [Arcobacter sp.]|tara:strand:+ start:4072 stop:5067 length:996 start_codon:yes stop_codon:yes gene_type:complete